MRSRYFLLASLLAVAQTAGAVGGFNRVVLPSSANAPGMFNSQFRTKVTILNVTQQSYSITATLYGTGGQAATASIPMSGGQLRVYDNFLADVFSYTGAGALVLESSAAGLDFIATDEVYNDLGAGRYKTIVSSGTLLENSLPEFDSFSLGVVVDGNNRTNIGYFNDATTEASIKAEIFDDHGTLVSTVDVTLAAKTWGQQGITTNVSNGYVRWRVTGGSAYCYAVVVDNRTSDGTFVAAADYLP